MSNIMHTANSELSMAVTAIALGFGKIMELLTMAEPTLAAISYIVAVVAGIVTIYYKIKNRGK